MGEQNRRTVDHPSAPPTHPRTPGAPPPDGPPPRALGPEADERQTARQAPDGASPGESAETDSIG